MQTERRQSASVSEVIMRPMRSAVVVVCTLGLLSSCGSSDKPASVTAAQARVTSQQQAVTDAQSAYDRARESFCADAKSYITSIDRYGKLFDQSAATVGDVKAAGTDLERPRESVTASARAVVDAREALAQAHHDLDTAQAELVSAQAAASGSSTAATTAPKATTTTTVVPPASIDRVKKAEADLAAASQGITDQTPLVRAAAEFNAAALALELSWLRLFSDAGCLTSEQQQKADAALVEYTVALQGALQSLGLYGGKIDGIYGPSTVEAVKKLQSAHGLPATGFVDQATSLALDNALVAKGGAAASHARTQTIAVQTTLKLAGYWPGAIDGHWTTELTTALKTFQTHLGVPPTGQVDTATLSAIQHTIESAQTATAAPSSSVPTGATPTTTP
jgi:murein L,D-transpeptidase YcbB/YkuD